MDCIENVTRRGGASVTAAAIGASFRVVPLDERRKNFQIGLEGGTLPKFVENFKRALKQDQVVYPEANMVPKPGGLRFFRSCPSVKRKAAVPHAERGSSTAPGWGSTGVAVH